MFVLIGVICWIVAEVYVFVAVADATSVLFALALLLATSVIGVLALRRQGARTLLRMRRTVAAGRAPTRELADGTGLVVGAALLVIPGFLSDALGLLLVIPGIRRVVGRVGLALVRRRRRLLRRAGARRTGGDRVIEGEVVDGIDGDVVEGTVLHSHDRRPTGGRNGPRKGPDGSEPPRLDRP